ncbi:MAG TPA: EF-hand domain-containing protein [Mycobacteriales bacterium]|nr:EF-hand domain-containing protein [Mycobacteriales bacterium]
MQDTVKNQKFNVLFDWFDQNKDGYLTADDFEQMANMFAALAQEQDSANTNAMRTAFQTWWGLLRDSGDVDADGRLTRQEFLNLMKSSVTAPGNFESAVLAIADALMRALDTDSSGTLTTSEYVGMYSALGIPPEHSTAAFHLLDRNGDGEISHDEFRTAIVEFYLSDDPNAPGNWLLGPTSQPA